MSLSDLLKSIVQETGAVKQEYACAYIRVSHQRSAEKATSPETQRRQIEEYAAKHGYIIIAWYTDLAKSAFRDEDQRVEFHRMIHDAKADPRTSVLIVWKYDRFSRGNQAQSQQEDLLRYGVRIESATEGYFDPYTASGSLMSGMTWTLSRYYSINLRAVVIPNMMTNFEQRDPDSGWAYKNGGYAQFGYKPHKINLGKNSKSMPVYKTIWVKDDRVFSGKQVWEWARTMLIDWRLGERLGYASIANRLTEAGVPTATGKSGWSMSTVRSLMGEWSRLYQYSGCAFWFKEDCTEKGNRIKRDVSEWKIVKDAHEAIISEEDCDAIFEMGKTASTRTKTNGRGKVSPYTLSGGIIKCAVCGSNWTSTRKRNSRYYLCGSHAYRNGSGCGPYWSLSSEMLEDFILTEILALMPPDEDTLATWVNGVNEDIKEQWNIYRNTAGDRAKKTKEFERRLSDYLNLLDSGHSSDELSARIADVSAHLKKLRALENVSEPKYVSLEEMKQLRKMVLSATQKKDSDEKGLLIKAMVSRIIADPNEKKLLISLRDPRCMEVRCMAVPRGVEPLSRP